MCLFSSILKRFAYHFGDKYVCCGHTSNVLYSDSYIYKWHRTITQENITWHIHKQNHEVVKIFIWASYYYSIRYSKTSENTGSP